VKLKRLAWAFGLFLILLAVGNGILFLLFGIPMFTSTTAAQIGGALSMAALLWTAPDDHPDDHEARYPDAGDTHQHLDDCESAAVAQKRASDDFYSGVSRGAVAAPRAADGEVLGVKRQHEAVPPASRIPNPAHGAPRPTNHRPWG